MTQNNAEKEANRVSPGQYVEMGYDLYTIEPDGSEKLVHQSDPSDPEKIVFGVTEGVIEPLEKALEGLEPGGEFDVKVKGEEAFGAYDPDKLVTLPKDIFLVDGKFDADHIKPGAALPMMTQEGFRITGLVKEVNPDNVVMDFNHPLAGKDLRFRGRVLTVRPATEAELKPAGGCCGHCGDADSDCGGCGGGDCCN